MQGTHPKDVVISDDYPKTLLNQKHADYIIGYSKKKDDYVSIWFFCYKMADFLYLKINGHINLSKKNVKL